ncbi:MAG: hypothetical protein IPL79_07895 [Myxococcales bacterium]|nr:hypothetical protein [Myxococcales bacterium]
MSEQHGFKRINFFKGFLTTEKDWNDAEQYHIEKRQLHARSLHAPGVVAGVGGDLKVIARARGDMSVEVQSGYAVDGQGRDLYVPEPVIKTINPDDYKLPQTVYLVLRYYEEFSDFIAYKENLDYKGHRRVLESCKVELSQTEPDAQREVELARITLEKGMTRVRDARDASDPRPGELDLRFAPRAGVAGSWLAPATKQKFAATITFLRKCATEFARRGVHGARDASATANAVLVACLAESVDLRNAFGLFELLLDAQGELVFDIDANHGEIAQKRELPNTAARSSCCAAGLARASAMRRA